MVRARGFRALWVLGHSAEPAGPCGELQTIVLRDMLVLSSSWAWGAAANMCLTQLTPYVGTGRVVHRSKHALFLPAVVMAHAGSGYRVPAFACCALVMSWLCRRMTGAGCCAENQ